MEWSRVESLVFYGYLGLFLLCEASWCHCVGLTCNCSQWYCRYLSLLFLVLK